MLRTVGFFDNSQHFGSIIRGQVMNLLYNLIKPAGPLGRLVLYVLGNLDFG